MLDHTGIVVRDLARSREFYIQALKPLALSLLFEVSAEQTGEYEHAGFGADRPFFWIGTGRAPSGPVHFAFTASARAAVDEFYKAALASGGRDKGAPGPRPHYGPTYYGAFVIDPDGNNVEAVCRQSV